MTLRGLGIVICVAVFSFPGCAALGPPGSPVHSEPATLSRESPAPTVSQTVIGCVPCAIYSIDINGRRASFARATPAGLLTVRGALKRNDRLRITLWRRFPCGS